MSYPVFESITETSDLTPTTTFTVDMPATVNSDDLLLAFLSMNPATSVVGTPTGWTQIDKGDTQSQLESAIYYRQSDGAEPATYDFTVGSAPVAIVGQVVRLSNWDTLQVPNSSAITDFASSTTPDPPSHTGFGGPDDFMFLNFIGIADDAATVSSYSSGWTGRGNVTADNGVNNSIGAACQTLNDNTLTTVDPGTLTLSEADLGNSVIVAALGAGGSIAAKYYHYRYHL